VRSPAGLMEADRRYVWHPFTQRQSWSDEELPLGTVIVLMPAPAMSYEDLRRLVAITAASIEEATAGRVLSAA
jgi:adenosylmethionine-8-amino-7-oxononanoate aminotransferase